MVRKPSSYEKNGTTTDVANMANKSKLDRALECLQANREAIAWAERRDLAASLADALDDSQCAETALAIVHILANDSKPEVRKEVADLLLKVPDDDFNKLAARLSEDTSSFVQKAVERALDRRRKGVRESQQRRRTVDQVEAQLDSIEKYHGKLAADRARKLADKQFDVLVGTTIHDIRGILSPLKTSISTLQSHLNSGQLDRKICRENLDKMEDRLVFLERFVNDMRAYSQATPGQRHRERVADMVKEATGIVLDELKGRRYDLDAVSLSDTVSENLTAEVARHQIVAAITHVLKNAFEAFEMTSTSQQDRRIEIRAATTDDESVEIVIRDNGPGIAAEDLSNIRTFNPGTTTKKNQGGTGFGLPTAQRYASAHGGSLTIESEEGQGVVVTITLPIDQEEIEA